MKTAIGSIFVFCLVLAPLSLAQSRHSAEQQILPLLHQQSLAANAHDTERFLAAFLRSDALIFAINGQVIHGWNNLHEQQAQVVEKRQIRCRLHRAGSARLHEPWSENRSRHPADGLPPNIAQREAQRRHVCRYHGLAARSRRLACHLRPRILGTLIASRWGPVDKIRSESITSPQKKS